MPPGRYIVPKHTRTKKGKNIIAEWKSGVEFTTRIVHEFSNNSYRNTDLQSAGDKVERNVSAQY